MLILDKNLISSTISMHVFVFCIAVTFIINENCLRGMLFVQSHPSNIYASLTTFISYLIEI